MASEEGAAMWRLLLNCQSQLRTSFAGVIGFDFPAVLAMTDHHGVNQEIAALLLPFADKGLAAALQVKRQKS